MLMTSTDSRVTRRSLLTYLALAYAGMWVAMAPLLLGGFRRGDARQGTGALEEVCIAVAMAAPALAAFVAVRFVERRPSVRAALALNWPKPWPRTVRACGLALAVPAGLTVAALALGTLTGDYPFGSVRLDGWGLAALGGMLMSLPLFFGEELGWQGFLFPRLVRATGGAAGLVRAYVLTGAAFALWHLPTLLMGGQYPGRAWYVAVPAMVVSCVLVLPVFTWLRLRSGSVVPAVIGHAFCSTVSVSMVKEFADADSPLDPLRMGLTGWPGWVVTGAFVAFLAASGRLRPAYYAERLAR
ncbi:CPBP family intramembrane glutamic endopeptidase [Streptomyces sp. NPDC087440]|uniref:CPBP family intramembrane glutamic endopeptidase n=1 Tax=Streptomyces sp. NPDC087440 TaxID=3365790 RepID=UPI0037FA286B